MTVAAQTLEKVPVRLIREPEEEIRAYGVEEDLKSLADSVEANCENAPIRLRPTLTADHEVYELDEEEFTNWVKDYEGEWRIVDGDRRYTARRIEGDQWLWARATNVDPDQGAIERVKENIHRKDVSAVEEGSYLNWLHEEKDLAQEKIADRIGKSPSYVSQRIDTIDWPKDVKQPVRRKKLDFSHARQLKRVTDDRHRTRLLNMTLNTQANLKAVKRWVNSWVDTQKKREHKKKRAEEQNDFNSSKAQADYEEARDQVKKQAHELRTTCDLHGGSVPQGSVTSFKVCDACLKILSTMREDIQRKLLTMKEELKEQDIEPPQVPVGEDGKDA